MTEKERINLMFPPDEAEYLRTHDNMSEFVSRLVRNHREGYRTQAVIIDYQIERLSGEIAEVEKHRDATIAAKEERIAELKDRKQRMQRVNDEQDSETMTLAKEALDMIDIKNRTPPAQYWSNELGCEIDELPDVLGFDGGRS